MYTCRKRQREQEIKQEESVKKSKEWDKKWEVGVTTSMIIPLYIGPRFPLVLTPQGLSA